MLHTAVCASCVRIASRCFGVYTKPFVVQHPLSPPDQSLADAICQTTIQWQGADESLRWTQPWGGAAPTTPAGTSTAASTTLHSGHQPPRRESATTSNDPEKHRPGALSSVGRTSPAPGGTSSSFVSCSSSAPKKRREMAAGAEHVDIPSPSPSQHYPDSYNPFHEEDMVSIAIISSGIGIPKNVHGTSNHRGGPSSPMQNTLSARPGPLGHPSAAGGATGGFTVTSSAPADESRATGRHTSRPPSSVSASSPVPSASSAATTGTAAAAAAGVSVATLSRSSGVASTRATARQGPVGGGSGSYGGRGASSTNPPPARRGQDEPLSLSPWPKLPLSPAASVRSRSRGPSVGRVGGAAPGNGQRRGEERSTSTTPAAQLLSPPRDESSSRKSHSGGPYADNIRHAGTSAHDASVGRGRGGRPADGTGRYPNRSGSDTPTGGFRGADRRGATVLGNEVGTAARSSALSPGQEGDDDEEEDSFGRPGLTVEAYMAKKRQSNVRSHVYQNPLRAV